MVGDGIRRVRWRAIVAATFCLALAMAGTGRSAETPKRPLTIDDVLDLESIDRVTLSPEGEWAAVVVSRPARTGEVYGRMSIAVDPSRSDVVLVSLKTGERRAITNGAADAAGYWCATWSPDGRRLAMLSTAPQGNEPRGGDNVRLYVWNRDSGALTRMSDAAVMTQTRYGGGIDRLDLRGGGDHGTTTHACSETDEKAPFLWLDEHRLLVAMLAPGQVSGLIDQYSRPFRVAADDAQRLRTGSAPTGRAVGSGTAREPRDEANSAILRIVDADKRSAMTVATVPTYPFRGGLSLSVSPDGRRAAVMATLGALQPQSGKTFANSWDDYWTVERRLGFVDLAPNAAIRWTPPPSEGAYPLELYSWSPDSKYVAWRGRADPFATSASLFVAPATGGPARRLGATSVGEATADPNYQHDIRVLWRDAGHLVARLNGATKAELSDWWLLGVTGSATNLTRDIKPFPTSFRVGGDGRLVAAADDALFVLDAKRPALVPLARPGAKGSIVWPQDVGRATSDVLIVASDGLHRISLTSGQTGPVLPLPAGAKPLDGDAKGALLWTQSGQTGLFLRETDADGQTRDLLALDVAYAGIAWGRVQLIEYKTLSGQDVKGAVILPPGYQPGRRYPTLFWVYEGYRVRGLEQDYFLDPMMSGIYNLQLYAANGYVVVLPTMPLEPREKRGDVYAQVTDGVLPAIDKMVALGIADPDRLGVMGQSYGGYSVFALLSQTNRFRGGVAVAGLSDLASNFGTFDPIARGYPGIEHEKSDNWAEVDQFGMTATPWADPAAYARISPLSYVDKVHTPLLIIHGDSDIRGAPSQSERFFYALYQQGKTARLVRYGGESHGLEQSPANIRDIHARMIGWFDTYLKK
jgi:dipeptidyl aminopeptidase/acylaminoacyl peptidase